MAQNNCCGLNFIKNLFIIFNILFLVSGVCILAISIWNLMDKYEYVVLLDSPIYPIVVYFLLAAAILVIISAFMGCYAVHRDSYILLVGYIFTLVLISLIEGMVGILAFIYDENLETELKMSLNSTFTSSYYIDESKTSAIDFLQESFRCCGALSFTDWQYSAWFKDPMFSSNKVPDTCCKSISEGCGKRDHPSNINYLNCLDPMAAHLKSHLVIICGVGLGLCAVQIFGVVLACKLYFKLSKREINEEEKPINGPYERR